MKRNTTLLFLFLVVAMTPSLLFAQDWLPFALGRTYQYKGLGDNQYYTLKVDSVEIGKGKETYFFDYKKIQFGFLQKYSMGYFGSQMFKTELGDTVGFVVTHFPRTDMQLMDTLYLKLKAQLGESWTFNQKENSSITLASKGLKEIFPGQFDSIQVLVTSLSDSIWLSKKFGLVKSRYFDKNFGTEYLQLDAIKELKLGVFLPDMRRMYDFEVGDMFLYEIKFDISSFCQRTLHEIDTITSKVTSKAGDTIWYEFNHTKTITVTELSVDGVVINPFTSQGFSVVRPGTTLYHDSLFDSIDDFEYLRSNTYVVGLGRVFSSVTMHTGLCSDLMGTNSSQLVCWWTSKSHSTEFNQCVSLVLDVNDAALFSGLRVYPNPAQEVLHIQLSEATDGMSVEIYDLMGTKCLSGKADLQFNQVDISSLNKGLYTVLIRNEKKSSSHKFLKE